MRSSRVTTAVSEQLANGAQLVGHQRMPHLFGYRLMGQDRDLDPVAGAELDQQRETRAFTAGFAHVQRGADVAVELRPTSM